MSKTARSAEGGSARNRPTQNRLEADAEILLDIPVQARSLQNLNRQEWAQYRSARNLLSSNQGIRSIPLGDLPLRGLGVLEALLAHAWSIRVLQPQEMVRLTETAVELARDLRCKRHRKKRVLDIQARAWGELANAYRTADHLRKAQQAFGCAYTLLQRGTGDPYLRARLFDLEASLLGTCREFPLALHRLSILSKLYRDLGEIHLAGRTLITRALYTSYSGDSGEAIELNAKGLAAINRQRDPILYMMSIHNHLLFLVELGHYDKARRALFESRPHILYTGGIGALRFRILEGRISLGLGELLSAELAFREAKEGLTRIGMNFFAAIVALELALALREQGRMEEAEAEVIVAREVFVSLEIYREYLGSVVFLEESFRRREATAELIQATIKHIERKWQQVGPSQMR